MKKNKAGLWWLPLVRRMAGWGVVMALSFGWLPLLCCGVVGGCERLWQAGSRVPLDDVDGTWDGIVLVSLYCGCLWALLGGLTGVVAGFFAPVSEPRNPLQSTFCRRVGRRTFWFWFWTSALVSCGFMLLALVMSEMPMALTTNVGLGFTSGWVIDVIGVAGLLFKVALPFLALWRAISMELKEVRLQGA